jgi:hypothetical protein
MPRLRKPKELNDFLDELEKLAKMYHKDAMKKKNDYELSERDRLIRRAEAIEGQSLKLKGFAICYGLDGVLKSSADFKDVEGVTERILSEMDDFIQTGKLPWLENEKRRRAKYSFL